MPSVIYFDGICNLCTGSVKFIIRRDPKRYFRFASLQSNTGKEFLSQHFPSDQSLRTFLLWEDGKLYTRSTAALRVARRLTGLWPLLYAFIIVPRFIRDGVYNWIAGNRYKWFGKKEECWIPTPELKALFLDQ